MSEKENKVRKEEGNERYEYFFPMEDEEKVMFKKQEEVLSRYEINR